MTYLTAEEDWQKALALRNSFIERDQTFKNSM